MNRLTAALYDRMFSGPEREGLRSLRAELLADVAGEVVEIGAGTGLNLEHYGSAVERLRVCEPNPHMRARLLARARPGVEVLDAPAEQLPMADGSVDVVVSTLVMCSVADVGQTILEARRVLRPGGRLVFLEHGASEDESGLRWQTRLEPFWKWLSGGCTLLLRPVDRLQAGGFEVERAERGMLQKMLPVLRPSTRGVARKPG